MDRLIYWLALGAITVIRHPPLAVCFVLGQLIGALLWAILPRYRKLARENLSAAFGEEMTRLEIRRMTFRHFTTLGANGLCAFKIAALPTETILRIAPLVEAFWKSIPEVDEVLSFAAEESILSLAQRLRGRFDAAILFPNSFRSALEAWLAAVPRRVGFRGHFRSMLLT